MGRNNEEFNAGSNGHKYVMQYVYNDRQYESPHQIVVGVADGPHLKAVGNMSWNDTNGEIQELFVHPDHRRQGLATRMYTMGKQVASENPNVVEPRHSTTMRSEAGELWAQTTPDYSKIAKSKIRKRLPGYRSNGSGWD